ncbi:MAG: biotin attachment protein [Planctomycetota bacterium]|nr:MAG: biotin attachment protein [Planctomycetota bacterium]
MAKKILFQDTSFRDGFQSFFGARALTDDFLPAVTAAVDAGITHLEAGGGARFQSLFMYCGESAFDMMDRFRKAAGPDANLQTLARGINVVALSAQPKDMIDLHAKMFKKHGITHIRNFDALNDMRNLKYSGECITNAGLHHQVVVALMGLPPSCNGEGAHESSFYLEKVKDIIDLEIPFDSICFKDASGTTPQKIIYDTVKGTREMLGDDVLLWHHTHETAALGVDQYMASINAGIDGICVSRDPCSGGTAQPDLLSMWGALRGTDYTLDIDINKVMTANAVFKDCMKDYFFPEEAMKVSSEVLLSPMPGGALTANTMMMRDTGTLDLYPKVIEAMADCVAKGGFGTSVTPVSQFYFQQAYANVTQGPWKKITEGYGNMVLGYFGKTPRKPDAEVIKIAEEQMGKKFFDGNPLDVIEPGIAKAKAELEKNNLPTTDENIFIAGALMTAGGNKGVDFLLGKGTINVRKISDEKTKADSKPAVAASPKTPASGPQNYTVNVDGRAYNVVVAEGTGQVAQIAPANIPVQPTAAATSAGSIEVNAKLPGNVLKVDVEPGQAVNEGDVLVVLEAMKMETPVTAPQEGTVSSVEVVQGDVVTSGQLLVTLS